MRGRLVVELRELWEMSSFHDKFALTSTARNNPDKWASGTGGISIGKIASFRYASHISIPARYCNFRGRSVPYMASRLPVIAAVVVALLFPAASQAARVAVMSNAWSAEVAADYNAKIPGHVFTGIDVSLSVPPLDTLVADFDVILLFEDRTFANATAVGNRVAEFANAGHAVVLGTFYDQDRSDATGGSTTPHGWGALETIDPNTTDGVGTSYAIRTLDPSSIVAHPLTVGVASLAALRGNPGPYAGGNQAKPGTIVVATWAQPNALGAPDPAIAYRQTGVACIIHIGIAPQYGVLPTFGTYGTDFSGDFYTAWKNAFDFAATSCAIPDIVPGDPAQIAEGFTDRAQLDYWRTGFDFAIILDGVYLQSGFGPPLKLITQPDGSIAAGG